MKKIIVNGLTESAGKTTLSLALYSYLQRLGKVSLFKPLAGNNYWYDYSIVMEGVREGRMFGKDAKLLSNLSGILEEIINPFHRLWAPSKILGKQNLSDKDLIILDRIHDSGENTILINNQTGTPQDLSNLLESENSVKKYSDEEEHEEYINSLYPPAFENSKSEMRDSDILIIESYSKVAIPHKVKNIDLAITVEPGKAHISEGEKFEEAHSMTRGVYMNYGLMETRTEKVLKLVNNETFPIFPLDLENNEFEKGYEKVTKAVEEFL